MKVSVLIPTYNRREYILDAIRSVIAQDYDDMEIIVVDDGSVDGTEEALEPFLHAIRYLRTENQGPALARNVGMQAARGDYIAYLDSDDLYYPFKIRLQAQLLDSRPDVGMVYSEFSAFSDDGFWDEFHLKKYHASAYLRGGVDYDRLFPERQSLDVVRDPTQPVHEDLRKWLGRLVGFGEIYEDYLFNTVVFTNSMMFRRDLLEKTGLQQKKFGMFHDLEFALRLCRQAKVAFMDVPTYKLRYHPEQISTTQKSKGELVAIKIQRDLLRVTKYHAKHDQEFYSRNRARVDRQLARLCRAVAVPLLSYDDGRQLTYRNYSKRARRYLASCGAYGQNEPLLLTLSFAPHLLRRIAFKLLAVRDSLRERLKRSGS